MSRFARGLWRLPRDLSIILLLRLWQAAAGLLTTALAVRSLSPDAQGWYYSFVSVAALYTLFDLGLSTALVNVTAHAFSGLRWLENYDVEGRARKQFLSLLSHAARWYFVAAISFLLLILPGGLWFFGAKPSPLPWIGPWLALSSLTAGTLILIPFLAVLEGSGQVVQVYAVRLTQAIGGSVLCWLLFACNAGLWATVAIPGSVIVVSGFWLLKFRFGILSKAVLHVGKEFNWQTEVWPLQWRLGLNWMCGYLLTQINIPLLFHTRGAAIAGQMGLSLAVVNTLSLVAQSWLLRRLPLMAKAVALRNWEEFDTLFKKDFVASTSFFLLGAGIVLGADVVLQRFNLATRFLPLPQLIGLLAFTFANQLIGGLAAHLRSFKREPFVWPIVLSALVVVPANYFASELFSSAGIIVVLCTVNLGVTLPICFIIWQRSNRLWRV